MKTKILMALLIFTVIPFFVNETVACQEEPNKAGLLTHLKLVKKETEELIQELAIGLKTMPTEYAYGKENYFFCLNMISEINQQLNNPIKNKIFNDHALTTSIELICNNMKTITDIENIITTNINLLLESISLYITENDNNDILLLKSIFAKHHAQYCQNDPDGDLVKMQFTELCHADILMPLLISSAIEWYPKLLKMINEKITELTPKESLQKTLLK